MVRDRLQVSLPPVGIPCELVPQPNCPSWHSCAQLFSVVSQVGTVAELLTPSCQAHYHEPTGYPDQSRAQAELHPYVDVLFLLPYRKIKSDKEPLKETTLSS